MASSRKGTDIQGFLRHTFGTTSIPINTFHPVVKDLEEMNPVTVSRPFSKRMRTVVQSAGLNPLCFIPLAGYSKENLRTQSTNSSMASRPEGSFPKTRFCRWNPRAGISDAQRAAVFQPSPFHDYRIRRLGSTNNRQSDAKAPKEQESKSEPDGGTTRHMDAIQFSSHEDYLQTLQSMKGDPLEKEGGRIVTYRGSVKAKMMIIGEAPGEMEDKIGKPFVGRAGQLLDKIFTYGGFDTETQVYITNIVKRRPRQNRTPNTVEMQYYEPYLLGEIRLIKPAIIILAGAVATQAMLGSVSISKVRGQWFGGGEEAWMMPIFHPAYLLRNPIRKHDMVTDIEEIRRKYMQLLPHEKLQPLKRSN
ncbi:Type-4 uracil-DNA glycosylase [Gracilariopsis chorda]|uniref:Type-4 uracil-DNA glycosylase n=1 Tax=Gracilariopsis chorda TaxID=448386 RepID=A0A2V3ILN4_9FLOR|nr:Type-4 uracil-DNA glycosylase [Gracilariopsis chorda]|eukprot:PXF42991.1 Type-4 uracil-DNA glycosylase [Gracilariopsis chorda]